MNADSLNLANLNANLSNIGANLADLRIKSNYYNRNLNFNNKGAVLKQFIDLFAGVGGFHFAFSNKAHCTFASEIDLNAQKTYALNFPQTQLLGDITQDCIKSAIPQDFDILCAGFPCQAFSVIC